MIAPAAFALAALILGAVSLYGRNGWLKASAYTGLVASLACVWWFALGHPKPIWLGVPKGTVAAYTLDEPHAIYVWLLVPGAHEPISVVLPWSEFAASQLNDEAKNAKKSGGQLRMGPLGNEDKYANPQHGSARFYRKPAPALPPKTAR